MIKREFYWKFFEQPKRRIRYFIEKYIFGLNTNPKHIQWYVDKHRNEILLDPPYKIVKLLGWTDQFEEDYYYVVERISKNGRLEVVYSSCVCGFIRLKNKLSNYDYYDLEHLWFMNTHHLKNCKYYKVLSRIKIK